MPDFKLTLSPVAPDETEQMVKDIMDNYGEDFYAILGDFMPFVGTDKQSVEVIVKDVAKGDIKLLIEDIYRDFGDEMDSMWVRVSKHDPELGNWFPCGLEDDD